jgi:hypothetical protein
MLRIAIARGRFGDVVQLVRTLPSNRMPFFSYS